MDNTEFVRQMARLRAREPGLTFTLSHLDATTFESLRGELWSNTDVLQGLTLMKCDLLHERAEQLANLLQAQTKLTQLGVVNCKMETSGFCGIMDLLARSSTLELFLLEGMKLDETRAYAMTKALKTTTSLNQLVLNDVVLRPPVMETLAVGIAHNSTLARITFFKNKIRLRQAVTLAEALKTNKDLHTVHVIESHVGPVGARAIGEALKEGGRLRDLTISDAKQQEDPNAVRFELKIDRESQLIAEDLLQQVKDLQRRLQAKETEERSSTSSTASSGIGSTSGGLGETGDLENRVRRLQDKLDVKQAEIMQLKQQLSQTQTSSSQSSELSQLTAAAETLLGLNMTADQVSCVTDAMDHKGRVLRGGQATLKEGLLAGHRVALKQITPVTRPLRLRDLLHTHAAGTATGDSHTGELDKQSKWLHREALALLRVKHPNIVQFHGLIYDEQKEKLSFVLSWAEGGSLYDRLHARKDVPKLTEEQRARIAMEVAGAMEFLHAHGIVHRDLKSPNVLLDGSLSAKVTDFGLCTFKISDNQTLTHQMGTLKWASPEQLLEHKLYADTDVFSFGVLYWELHFNCKPWHHGKYKGKSASLADIMAAYKDGEYLPYRQEINGVTLSAAQQQVVGGCFAVSGNRLDFTQLHAMLQTLYKAAREHKVLGEAAFEKTMFGEEDAVWKYSPATLRALDLTPLKERDTVNVARLDVQRHDALLHELVHAAGSMSLLDMDDPFSTSSLAAAAVVHCRQKLCAFYGAITRNKTRYRGAGGGGGEFAAFRPRYPIHPFSGEPSLLEDRAVLARVTGLPLAAEGEAAYPVLDRARLRNDGVRVQRVFHGVNSFDAAHGIVACDFARLQGTDAGWYGAGIYFTPDLAYAKAYAVPCAPPTQALPSTFAGMGLSSTKKYQVVLACDIQYGNPYPVTNATLHEKTARPLTPGHDAHVMVVDFSHRDLDKALPFECSRHWELPGAVPVAELVVEDLSSILVRAILVFEAKGVQ